MKLFEGIRFSLSKFMATVTFISQMEPQSQIMVGALFFAFTTELKKCCSRMGCGLL